MGISHSENLALVSAACFQMFKFGVENYGLQPSLKMLISSKSADPDILERFFRGSSSSSLAFVRIDHDVYDPTLRNGISLVLLARYPRISHLLIMLDDLRIHPSPFQSGWNGIELSDNIIL
jgi:hypothetical protein